MCTIQFWGQKSHNPGYRDAKIAETKNVGGASKSNELINKYTCMCICSTIIYIMYIVYIYIDISCLFLLSVGMHRITQFNKKPKMLAMTWHRFVKCILMHLCVAPPPPTPIFIYYGKCLMTCGKTFIRMIVIMVGAACMCHTIAIHDICMNVFTNVCLSSCVCGIRNSWIVNASSTFVALCSGDIGFPEGMNMW